MTINQPTKHEKEQAIEQILSEGLEEPEGIRAFFMRMVRTLGLNYIFYNLSSIIALSVGVIIVLVFGFMVLLIGGEEQYPYTIIFLLSPLSYVSVMSLTTWIERSHSIYELKMTFKYTVKDLVIFRTLCFSMASIIFSVILSLGMTQFLAPLRSLSIAFSGLFLCTLFTVAVTRRFYHRWDYFTSFGVWGVVNFMPFVFFGSRWEAFLSQVPVGLILIVSIILMVLNAKEIKQFIHMKDREVEYNVAS